MNATILALGAYILWLMLLLLLLAGFRAYWNQANKRKSMRFNADGSDLNETGFRITRAHMNAVESFAFVGGTLLLALATNSTSITNDLAYVVIGARIVQSIVHIASVSNTAVMVRFVFFLIQFVICGYWLIRIFEKFML